MELIVCPNCSANASSDDFTCANCGVILNELATVDEPVSIVEALLAPANAASARSGASDSEIGSEVTTVATVLMDEFTVPRLLQGIDLALKPLTPFEAYVASFIDGAHSVPELAAAAEISSREAMAILQTLAFRDVVELNRDEQRQPGAPPELDEEPKTDPNAAVLAPELSEEPRTPVDEALPVAEPSDSVPAAASDATAPASMEAVSAGAPSVAAPPGSSPVASPGPPSAAPPRAPATGSPPARPPPVLSRAPTSTTAAATGARPIAERPVTRGHPSPVLRPAEERAPTASRPQGGGAQGGSASRPLSGSPPAPTASRPRTLPLEERPTTLGSSPSIEYTLEKAIALERRGDFDGAVYILKKAIAQSRHAAPLYNKLALALLKRKEFKEAVAMLEKAVELAPDDSSYQQNLYKVMGLAAASGKGRKDDKSGVLSGLFKRK